MQYMENEVRTFYDWLKQFRVEGRDSNVLYDDMLSQSGQCLPQIYVPFDPCNAGHWHDAGLVQDFFVTACSADAAVLDFGPGDGWPSLMLSPFVRHVTGVDASQKRVDVCRENASRMGITNADFVYYQPGQRLPFEDDTFDAVVAASSIEQCPDIPFILKELFRVLKPGGRLRMYYEALQHYRRANHRIECWINAQVQDHCGISIAIRDFVNEHADYAYIQLGCPKEELLRILDAQNEELSFARVASQLNCLTPYVKAVSNYGLHHPSATSWLGLLNQAGFVDVKAMHNAGAMRVRLQREMAGNDLAALKAMTLQDAYRMILPLAKQVCHLAALLEDDPMISASKSI